MNGMLNAANRNFRSIGGNFSNFHSSASPVNRVSEEIYSQQAVDMPYTSAESPLKAGFRGFLRGCCGDYLHPADCVAESEGFEP